MAVCPMRYFLFSIVSSACRIDALCLGGRPAMNEWQDRAYMPLVMHHTCYYDAHAYSHSTKDMQRGCTDIEVVPLFLQAKSNVEVDGYTNASRQKHDQRFDF